MDPRTPPPSGHPETVPGDGQAVTGPRPGDLLGDGRYRVEGRLGAGGTAVVVRAHDTVMGVDRAIKVLTVSDHRRRGLQRRMHNEARAMAGLDHPHVLRVYDIEHDDEHDFIVMELAPGGSLQDRIDRDGPLPPRQAVAYAVQVLAALAAAHARGIVHRDVKPQNILLDDQGRARLADFGIALLTAEGTARGTRTGMAMGSLAFMAPEQRLDASKVTVAADIYAVGTTLYHLLTGANPVDLFAADEARWATLPPPLVPILIRATLYEPERRYTDSRELAQALVQAMPGADLPAAKPPSPEQFPLPSPRVLQPDDSRLYPSPSQPTVAFEEATSSAIDSLLGDAPPRKPTTVGHTWVDTPSDPPPPRRSRSLEWAGALLGLAVVMGGAWWWTQRPPAVSEPEVSQATPSTVSEPKVTPQAQPQVTEPEVSQATPSTVSEPKVTPQAQPPASSTAPPEAATPQPTAHPKPAIGRTAVSGRWSGSLGGRPVSLRLRGDPPRGEATTGSGEFTTSWPVSGALADGQLTLRDGVTGDDQRGTWNANLTPDGQVLIGSWVRSDGVRVVPFKLSKIQ